MIPCENLETPRNEEYKNGKYVGIYKSYFFKSILKISNMLKKKNNVGYVKYVEIKYITTIT